MTINSAAGRVFLQSSGGDDFRDCAYCIGTSPFAGTLSTIVGSRYA
jgi:hypothetical protein